jgi:hypothetical protein
MPRYIVERSFPDRVQIPAGIAGVDACRGLIETNDEVGVTWIHSYVREDRRAMFCIYDAPTPEAIRRASERNRLPVERITRVTVLDPYFYTALDFGRGEESDVRDLRLTGSGSV